jgi:two-component system, LytTR family, sensor kinase
MLKRDELGFPSFWQLQFAGWVCLYWLVLGADIPGLKRGRQLQYDSLAVALMFLGSCLLRPVCRTLLRRSFSWLALEIRAFAWSLLAGSVLTFVMCLAILGVRRLNWTDFLGNDLQFSVVLFLWCSLYFSIKQWQRAARERERLLRAEAEVREARLSALRYQLNPHFLFNSLNAVSTLVLEGNAPQATRMLAQIGELLRTTLDQQIVTEVPFSQEIAFTEQYLAIEQTRLGRRLRIDLAISPETLDALVPSMLLQPLVENAVRHGIAPLVEGGTIVIQSKLHDGQLQIIVKNSGVIAARENKPTSGIGLTNTMERLQTLYGAAQRFALQWPASGGCEVTAELPFRKGELKQGDLVCAH